MLANRCREGAAWRLAGSLVIALTLAAPPAQGQTTKPAFQTQTFAYTRPERQPKGPRNRYVEDSADAVFQQLWAWVEEQQLKVESVNPTERIIVARYSGDPRPFLDCGVVTLLVDGKPADPPKEFSAAKEELRTTKTANKRRYGLLRQLLLDARLVLRVEPRGKGARAYSDAIYVVTKTLRRVRKGGKPDELVDRDVISFRSDETGQFKKGTTCVGTGKLEAMPLEPFRKPAS
jgi:hypothetical protein